MDILNFFGVSSYTWEIEIVLNSQKTVEVNNSDVLLSLTSVSNLEPIGGLVRISHPQACSLEHEGIQILLIGETEQCSLEASEKWDFQTYQHDIAPPGTLIGSVHEIPFCFDDIDLHESYYGVFAVVRYYIKVILRRKYAFNLSRQIEFFSTKYSAPLLDSNALINLVGGVDQCLHIQYHFPRKIYHLNDVIFGSIFFHLIRIKIVSMELSLIRREKTKRLPPTSTVISSFEIMDGTPVKGETIPIRMFLGELPLTPSYSQVEGVDVTYYIKAILLDEQNMRYVHKSRIFLWRQDPSKATEQPKFLLPSYNPFPTDKTTNSSQEEEGSNDSWGDSSGEDSALF